jgi:N-hydroxyarylamine O-acetyltransferase
VHVDVERYLARLGFVGEPRVDLETLEALHLAHLTSVPFENLDIVYGGGVPHDQELALDKIVNRGRGGWCFENNGAFAALLSAIGFDVLMLGAAVLSDGPSDQIEHLALEVTLDEVYLADVGFGENFLRPLALNRRGPQDGLDATYEFLPSAKGTTLTRVVDGVYEPQYRFRRVAHAYDEFAGVAHQLQTDPERSWASKPFATRILNGTPDRVWLLRDRLRLRRGGDETVTPVDDETWDAELMEWFSIAVERN